MVGVNEVKLGTNKDTPALLQTAGCVSSHVGLANGLYRCLPHPTRFLGGCFCIMDPDNNYHIDGTDYFGMYAGLELGLLSDDEIDELLQAHSGVRTAFCMKCKQTKPASEFDHTKHKEGGVVSHCKSCYREHMRIPKVKENLKLLQARRRSRRMKAPTTLTPNEWHLILERYNRCCAYCGKPESEVGTLAQDHVYPISRGGGYTALNIVPACKSCNSRKSAHTPAEVGFILKRIPLAQLGLFDND